jgi:hypothetical protein
MKEDYGNIWHMPGDAICITTNGFVKKNGEAVMGAGIAKEANNFYPGLAKALGEFICIGGNRVHPLYFDNTWEQLILSFPVKHNWWEKADMELIRKSCQELIEYLDVTKPLQNVLLPRPGCGNGKLQWKDVKREIKPLLDDRITVVTFYKS